MTLDELPLDTAARVTTLAGSRALRLRLMELGMVPGALVRKVRVAPLGDPVELALRGGRLSLRRHEVRHIEVAE